MDDPTEHQDHWILQFQKAGALWFHDGNTKRPHALLTSGNHSDGFFNAGKIIFDDPLLAQKLCIPLRVAINRALDLSGPWFPLHRVVGSAFGAVTLAANLAAEYNRANDADYFKTAFAFTEQVSAGEDKQMVLNSRFVITPDEKILVVEDVVTTGGTTLKTIAALEEKGAKVLPVIGAILNRSGNHNLGKRKIAALINLPMNIWTKEECPLCQSGSEAVRPKTHWAQLTADYPK